MEKFYLVWGDGGGVPTRVPTHKHPTLTSTRLEAERLALKARGERFVVLEALEACSVVDVKWDKCDEEGVPF